MEPVSVLLVMQQTAGLQAELEQAGDVVLVGAVNDQSAAMTHTARLQPDYVVIDYDIPYLDGIATLRGIAQENERAQTVVMSESQDVTQIRSAMRAGARDYLFKPVKQGEVVETIRWLVRERRDYARMSSFMNRLRRAYETMFYDDKPVPERVVRFLEAQSSEPGVDLLTLETLAVAYARNRQWAKLKPLAALLA
ncbi:MAG: response regulator [Anaerolineae bacterium]